jgi:hypothetical protein
VSIFRLFSPRGEGTLVEQLGEDQMSRNYSSTIVAVCGAVVLKIFSVFVFRWFSTVG